MHVCSWSTFLFKGNWALLLPYLHLLFNFLLGEGCTMLSVTFSQPCVSLNASSAEPDISLQIAESILVRIIFAACYFQAASRVH
ncbi:MAG: hypothetical protein JOS17DRAFT_746309 [Linnemannia elongata]|nr:MAG: hypothetical protein JOS17DRAFT_746309 [Linnemannia elongata]